VTPKLLVGDFPSHCRYGSRMQVDTVFFWNRHCMTDNMLASQMMRRHEERAAASPFLRSPTFVGAGRDRLVVAPRAPRCRALALYDRFGASASVETIVDDAV
jgi:hypothetical protein